MSFKIKKNLENKASYWGGRKFFATQLQSFEPRRINTSHPPTSINTYNNYIYGDTESNIPKGKQSDSLGSKNFKRKFATNILGQKAPIETRTKTSFYQNPETTVRGKTNIMSKTLGTFKSQERLQSQNVKLDLTCDSNPLDYIFDTIEKPGTSTDARETSPENQHFLQTHSTHNFFDQADSNPLTKPHQQSIKPSLNPLHSKNSSNDLFYYNLYACFMNSKLKNNRIAAKIDIIKSQEITIEIAGKDFLAFKKSILDFVSKHAKCGQGCRHLEHFYRKIGLIYV